MKNISIIFALTLTAVLGAASVSSKGGKLEFVNGKVEFSVPGGGAKTIFTPAAAGKASGPFTAAVVDEKTTKALVVRGKGCSLTFQLDKAGRSACRVSLPYNAVFSVETANPEVIVIPDSFGEDLLLKSGNTAYKLPGELPFFTALQDNGNQTLSVIPFRGRNDITVSADLKTWSFKPGLLEEYIFAVNQAKNIWFKSTTALSVKDRTPINWQMPFNARFRAAFPVQHGFTGNLKVGHYIWNIASIHPKYGSMINRPPRMSVSNKKSLGMWCSGFDGSFRYPALQEKEGVKLNYPHHAGKGFAYDKNSPVYIYAYDSGSPKVKADLPYEYLDSDGIAKVTNERNSSIGIGPATCHLTSDVIEKIFYRGEAVSHKAQLISALARTQLFVESIRARIDSYLLWAEEMESLCRSTAKESGAAELNAFAANFAAFKKYHDELLPRMKTPEIAFSYQTELLKAVNDPANDEEVLEEKGKIFGRNTRTIGGAQDACVARMRHIAKCIRQQALVQYTTSTSTAAKKVYLQIYTSAGKLMQNYYDHEGK